MSVQPCPNCGVRNDVSIFVHGQWTRCHRCGIRFAVQRGRRRVESSPRPPKGTRLLAPDGAQHGLPHNTPRRARQAIESEGLPTEIAPAPFSEADTDHGREDVDSVPSSSSPPARQTPAGDSKETPPPVSTSRSDSDSGSKSGPSDRFGDDSGERFGNANSTSDKCNDSVPAVDSETLHVVDDVRDVRDALDERDKRAEGGAEASARDSGDVDSQEDDRTSDGDEAGPESGSPPPSDPNDSQVDSPHTSASAQSAGSSAPKPLKTEIYGVGQPQRTPTPVLLSGVAGDEPAWLPSADALPASESTSAPKWPDSGYWDDDRREEPRETLESRPAELAGPDADPVSNSAEAYAAGEVNRDGAVASAAPSEEVRQASSDRDERHEAGGFATPAHRRNPRKDRQEPESPQSGAHLAPRIPGYDLEVLLGRGGMGEVWKARQISLQRPVAIKLLSPSLAVEPDFVRRFERESNALAALSHPHVVAIFDRGSADGTWYFVMELVEGRSLREKINEQAPGGRDLLRLLAQVARAIDYAHRKGVIHRDLKPENVLVDHAGNAKVADFGLAGMSEVGRSELTMTAVAMGTAHYMAPEQRRDAKHVDGRADLYSLGVMLYESLTGELPVGRFSSPREKDLALDPRLDAMVLRLLDPEPSRRPDRGSEVAELLETILADSAEADTDTRSAKAGDTRTAGPHRPVPPAIRRSPLSSMFEVAKGRPVARWMLGVAVALLVAVVAVSLRKPEPPPSTEPVHFPATVELNGDRAQVSFGDGQPDAVVAVAGGWSLTEDGALIRDSGNFAPPREPRAVLGTMELDLSNAALEVDVRVDPLPKATDPPKAELLLYFDVETHVGVRLGLEEDTGYALFSTTPIRGTPESRVIPGAGVEPPTAGRDLRLAIMTVNGRATALIDGRQVASVPVSGIGGVKAKAALGCRGAICRFTGLRMSGKIAEPVLQAEAQ